MNRQYCRERNLLMISGELAVYVAVIGASVICLTVILIINMKRPIVSLDVRPDSEWRLALVTRPGRKYKLCHRFHIQFDGSEEEFGLVADYTMTAGGETLIRERAGVGSVQPPYRDRFITLQKMVSYGTNSLKEAEYGHSMHKATIVLATVGPFDQRTELIAGGKIMLNPGTRMASGKVYFA